MTQAFIRPNWHIILIHYPLALLVVGLFIELFSFMWRRNGVRAAGRWMILLGALSMIPASMVGINAFSEVARADNPDAEEVWVTAMENSPLSPEAMELMERHIWLQAVATGLTVLVVTLWLGSSDRRREKLHIPFLILLLGGVGLMLAGAWYGGEAVYGHGVGVQRIDSGAIAAGDVPPADRFARIQRYVDPLQLHTLLAGVAVAIAMGAMGLSLRLTNHTESRHDHSSYEADPELTRRGIEEDFMRSLNPSARIDERPRVPAARFWLLACLVAALTGASGMWFLVGVTEVYDPKALWPIIRDLDRRLYHVCVGGAIVILPLLLAATARWAYRRKWLVLLLSLGFLAAVGAQIRLGVLLMFDTAQGSVMRFNEPMEIELPVIEAPEIPIPEIVAPGAMQSTTVPATAPATAPAH